MYLKKDTEKLLRIIDEALNRAFVFRMQPSIYGLATVNQMIFVRSNSMYSMPSNSTNEAVMALTIFNELAHYIRSCKCKTYADAQSYYTHKSESECIVDVSELSDYKSLKYRRELRFDPEIKLLGEELFYINAYASDFLFEGDMNNLDSFRNQLISLNKEDSWQRTYMRSNEIDDSNNIKRRCGVSHR